MVCEIWPDDFDTYDTKATNVFVNKFVERSGFL